MEWWVAAGIRMILHPQPNIPAFHGSGINQELLKDL